MHVISSKNFLLSGLVIPLLLFASSSHAFTDAETNELMRQCVENTQQQYGYNLQLSREYCQCSITRITAYMEKHNLKQGVKAPAGTDKEAVAKAFINIPVLCAREILTR